ncbi:MAG: DUF3299 domain-containing protein [Pirellulales bacterium]
MQKPGFRSHAAIVAALAMFFAVGGCDAPPGDAENSPRAEGGPPTTSTSSTLPTGQPQAEAQTKSPNAAAPDNAAPQSAPPANAASNNVATDNAASGAARSPSAEPTKRRSPVPAAKPSANPVEVTFDDIKLDLEKDEPFVESKRTERLDVLDGERIRIRGFILPGYQQTGLQQFVLVRDNMQCCFGPGAALFDCIVVEMVGDKSTDFSVRPVAVEGIFEVQELKDPDGRQLAIYHLAGEDVR